MIDVSAVFDAVATPAMRTVFESGIAKRLQATKQTSCTIDALVRRVRRWQKAGSVVVFSAGGFDVLHPSHLLALTHYRLFGACEYLHRQGNKQPSLETLHAVAASDKVRLVISVDSDARIAALRGFVAAKGGAPKPLVSWNDRTLLLAGQNITKPDGVSARPLIDFIAMHGIQSCPAADCPHQDNALIAATIKPDVVAANAGSPETIEQMQANPALNGTKLAVIHEAIYAYFDPILGGPIGTSQIIKRARQGL